MTKEFIPYEEALTLKELGFDEECFGYYDEGGNLYTEMIEVLKAPLYQQAFRWFREKFKLHSCIFFENDTQYYFQYVDTDNIITLNTGHKSYEEAELACLKRLIELVKKQ